MIIIRLLLSAAAVLIAAYLLPGVETTLTGAVVLAVVLGVINLFLKPVLRVLTLPLTVLTLGLFALVLNALLVLLADALVPGFSVAGFWSAFFFAIIVALINALFHALD